MASVDGTTEERNMTNEEMLQWLLLGATFFVPLVLRFLLISKFQTSRWKANLAAIGFIPSLAIVGSALAIASMSEQDIASAGMAMIFPLFVVGIPLIAAIVAVIVAEFIEVVS